MVLNHGEFPKGFADRAIREARSTSERKYPYLQES